MVVVQRLQSTVVAHHFINSLCAASWLLSLGQGLLIAASAMTSLLMKSDLAGTDTSGSNSLLTFACKRAAIMQASDPKTSAMHGALAYK
jgi:hypothetical protein